MLSPDAFTIMHVYFNPLNTVPDSLHLCFLDDQELKRKEEAAARGRLLLIYMFDIANQNIWRLKSCDGLKLSVVIEKFSQVV